MSDAIFVEEIQLHHPDGHDSISSRTGTELELVPEAVSVPHSTLLPVDLDRAFVAPRGLLRHCLTLS